jgi:hypothetical protein
MPWLFLGFRRLLTEPSLVGAVTVALCAAAIGAFSPHVFLIGWVLASVASLAFLGSTWLMGTFAWRRLPWVLVAGGGALALSSYWIVPLVAGKGYEGTVISTSGAGDVNSYAAVSDPNWGLLPNVLGLYGFWAEASGRFIQMKSFVPLWPAVLGTLLAVCAVGAVVGLLYRRSEVAPSWIVGLIVFGVVSSVLELGVSSPATAGLVTWLDTHLVLYRGMRDAGKWAVSLALIYSQLFPLGVAAILDWIRVNTKSVLRREWLASSAAALLLALPLAYGNGLLFGAHGEIEPSQYPQGWYAADLMLLSDPNHGRALFLPWHEYMRYSFIKNQNSIVASPAPTFFSVPVLTSQDPEVPGIAPPATPDQEAVRGLVAQGSNGDWADTLPTLGVRYVLVDKDLDWQTYRYLDSQRGLTKVADLASIVVYRDEVPASAHPLSQSSRLLIDSCPGWVIEMPQRSSETRLYP